MAAAVAAAASLWQSTGLSIAEQARLDAVDVHLADLPTNVLGWTIDGSHTVWIDADAAGHGWNIEKYEGRRTKDEAGSAIPHSDFRIPTSMDLLTVLAHELGHVIGHGHDNGGGLMSPTLDAGVRASLGSDTNHQTTRLPDHQTLFRNQESGESGQLFSGSTFSALDTPLLGIPHSDFRLPHLNHPASRIQHSALRTPHSALALDSLFARLDDESTEPIAGVHSEDHEAGGDDRDEAESGLDLWTVLYGLE
jgi:hypothetical protein